MEFLMRPMTRNSLRIIILLFTISFLTACNKSDEYQDIDQRINQLKEQPPKPISPLPTFKAVETYTYSVEGMRSPFAGSAPRRGDAPNANRPKEPLEAYPLDALKMVGLMRNGKNLWAIILASNGVIYKVRVGNYIGQNYGRITAITPTKIELLEMIQDGDNWVQKPASLVFTEKE